ncbi:MAG: alpha/beta hydrolase family protein, partial [Candidatus Limnocylindria bacterium]
MLQRVSFPVTGNEVEGVLHLPDGECAGGVIEMGGGDSEQGAYVCDALAASGVAALRFAFRIQRDTAAGLIDAAAAIRLLRAHPAIPQRVGVVGHSQGGLVAAVAAGRDSRVRA